jgi:uncharacterized membrane protein YfcA
MVLFSYFALVISAFLLEVVDSSTGIGYGTILASALLLIGFDLLQTRALTLRLPRLILAFSFCNRLET